jgi:glutaredoxin
VPLITLALYTRPDCCLCDDARAALVKVSPRHAFELEEVDISGDPALTDMYGERVPVVMLDGVPVLELRIEEADLDRVLASRAEAVS